jgi:hypothetical protein
LSILLSNARYAALPHALPWVTPGNPDPFIAPPAVGTGPQIDAAKTLGKTSNRSLNSALTAQVVKRIDPIYIRALLNRANTPSASASTSALLITHLFNTYGKITFQQVNAKEMELYNMHYDISQPVNTVFNCIDDLSELADHAGSPPMTAQ